MGRSSIKSLDDELRGLFSERFTVCHSQASARDAIEGGLCGKHAVVLWFIVVLR